jgi:8-oxo-dGTP diphosphatase
MLENQPKPKVGVGVAVIKDNKILLGKRKNAHGAGSWAFPGGHLEFGEEVEECAKRELAEETGLKALSLKPGPWLNHMMEGDKHYVTLIVYVNEFEGDLQLLEPHKCEGWEWFDCNALPSPLFPIVESLLILWSGDFFRIRSAEASPDRFSSVEHGYGHALLIRPLRFDLALPRLSEL